MLVPFPSSIDVIQHSHQTTTPTEHTSPEYWPRLEPPQDLCIWMGQKAHPQDLSMANSPLFTFIPDLATSEMSSML